MRLLLLTPDLNGRSGWSRYALDLGKALQEQGHEIHCIVAQKADAPWCKQYAYLRQPTSYLHSALLRWIDGIRVALLIAKIRPDIVHVMAEPYALLIGKKRPFKTCMTIHGTYAVLPLSIPAVAKSFRNVYRTFDAILSVSHFTKYFIKERDPALFEVANLEKKITILENAVDLSRFSFEKKQASGTKRILSVSAVKQKKGYLEAIEAVALFLKEHPIPLQYDIIGSVETDSGFVAKLREFIKAHTLEKIVTLHGSVDEETLEKAYHDADVFLLPSLQSGDFVEGFGLVFLEANARGTPVIGPTTGGCLEAICDGLSGYVCDPTSTMSIAQRLEDILVDQAIDPAACRKWAEQHDIRQTAKRLEAICNILLLNK